MSDELLLPTGQLGYSIHAEDRDALEENGQSPELALNSFRASFPALDIKANPLGAVDILDQKNQGACQGHALAMVFSICFFLATGRRQAFSRAAGYYLSQRHNNIRGDHGSTLSGGQWVATQHGMCLETDWRYPSSYYPQEPPNVPYLYKLKVTRPMRTAKEVTDWIDAGLPVQTGIYWNDSCSREVVNNWRPGGGGHSTCLWQRAQSGNVNNLNSWGPQWNGDGVHEFTEGSIARMLADSNTTLIGYAPDEMSFPDQEPIR